MSSILNKEKRADVGFSGATDLLTRPAAPSLEEVAQAFGVTPTTLSRWRSDNFPQQPPREWPAVVGELALRTAERHEEHARALRELGAKLGRREG